MTLEAPKKEWLGEPGYCNCLLVSMTRLSISKIELKSNQKLPILDDLVKERQDTADWVRAQQFDYQALDSAKAIEILWSKSAGLLSKLFGKKKRALDIYDAEGDSGPLVRRVIELERHIANGVVTLVISLKPSRAVIKNGASDQQNDLRENMKIESKVLWSWYFKDENFKPILCAILVAVLIVVGAIKLYYHAVALDNEFAHLAKHGRVFTGKITKFEPYLRHMSSEGGPTAPLKGVAVEIKSKDFDESILETWDYSLKESYRVGDTVKLYYDEENKRVKVASENHKDFPKPTP